MFLKEILICKIASSVSIMNIRILTFDFLIKYFNKLKCPNNIMVDSTTTKFSIKVLMEHKVFIQEKCHFCGNSTPTENAPVFPVELTRSEKIYKSFFWTFWERNSTENARICRIRLNRPRYAISFADCFIKFLSPNKLFR